MIADAERRGSDQTTQTVNQDEDCCMEDQAQQVHVNFKMTKRVTFANQLVSDAAPPVSEEHFQSLKSNWYSNQEDVQSERAASADASRLAQLQASGVRFAENDYYEVMGLEVREYCNSVDRNTLVHLASVNTLLKRTAAFVFHLLLSQKYMSQDLLHEITERKRSHIQGVFTMQQYCSAMALSQLSVDSSAWTRDRAHDLALLYFGFPGTV